MQVLLKDKEKRSKKLNYGAYSDKRSDNGTAK